MRCGATARLVLLLAAALGAPAHARDWPETAGWTIFESDDYCAMTIEYEGKGDTELIVSKNVEGRSTLIVTNYGWSATKDGKYDVAFVLNGTVFGGGGAVGTHMGARKGFGARFEPDFWPAFKAGSSLRMMMGETLVDHLNLVGSAAAGAVVDRCVEHVRGIRAAEAREKARFAHIPDDPFAKESGKDSPE